MGIALRRSCPQYVPGFEKMPLAPAFILILVVLLFRPEGLFGRKQVSGYERRTAPCRPAPGSPGARLGRSVGPSSWWRSC